MQRLSDIDIVAVAKSEQRVVVTFDLDFSAIMARNGEHLPSIIQFRTDDARTEEIGKLLAAILPVHAETLIDGCILTIEPDRIRVRRLPLS